MHDQQQGYYQLEVMRYCDYCLNPVTFKLPGGDQSFSQTFVCLEGLTLCSDCWQLAFYNVEFIPSFLASGMIDSTNN